MSAFLSANPIQSLGPMRASYQDLYPGSNPSDRQLFHDGVMLANGEIGQPWIWKGNGYSRRPYTLVYPIWSWLWLVSSDGQCFDPQGQIGGCDQWPSGWETGRPYSLTVEEGLEIWRLTGWRWSIGAEEFSTALRAVKWTGGQ